MHRIDTSTAQKDKFGAGKNGFTTGDPQSGTPATEVSAEILDALQEEIAAVIEDPDSGLELNKSDNGQLIAAIKKIITSKAAPDASETQKGIARFATAAESAPATEGAASQSLSASIARVFTVLRCATANASETLRGSLRIATQTEINAGNDDSIAISPKKLRAGFVINFSSSGSYIAFPTWMGGFIVQFGSASIAPSVAVTVTLPTTYPTEHKFVISGQGNDLRTQDGTIHADPSTTSTISLYLANGAGSTAGTAWWLSIGR